MEIYIEQILLDNFFMDYVIIKITSNILKFNRKRLVLCLCAIIGTFSALILPLFRLNNTILLILKLILGLLMILPLKKYKSIKELLLTFCVMCSITFLFGGLCFALLVAVNKSSNFSSFLLGKYEIPFGLCGLVVLLYNFILNKLIKAIKRKSNISNYYCNIELTMGICKYELKGFIDSGNKIIDTNGSMVSLITFDCFKIINKQVKDFKNIHLLEINSVVGKESIMVFDANKIRITSDDVNFESENVCIGVVNKKFKDFDCLLNGGILS